MVLRVGAERLGREARLFVRKNPADSDEGVVGKSGTTSFHVEWRSPFVRNAPAKVVGGSR